MNATSDNPSVVAPLRFDRRAWMNQWIKNRRLAWVTANGPCAQCGSTTDLQVDHVDPSTKVDHRIWSWSEERRLAELAKCQVLCGDCHKAKTSAENSKRFTQPIKHGTYMGYAGNHACRCDLCTEANRNYKREWKRRRRLADTVTEGPSSTHICHGLARWMCTLGHGHLPHHGEDFA